MIALDRLEQIIPSGIALANKALAVGLQQISLDPMTELSNFANATATLRTCSDLPLVNDLTTPVPPEVAEYFAQNVADGSGPNGTYIISDFFGTLAGITGLNYIAITNILSVMATSSLQLVYETMNDVVTGQFGTTTVTIPHGLPAAGTYPSQDAAVANGLVPAAKTAIASIIALYPFQVTLLNTKWAQVDDQPAVRECLLQQKAGLDWSQFEPENQLAMQSFIQDLPNKGLDLEPGGSHWFLQSISNVQTLAGQSVIGCLREGVNQVSLSRNGLNTATDIPVTPTVEAISQETGNGGSAVPNP